jgi:hypothetical protein
MTSNRHGFTVETPEVANRHKRNTTHRATTLTPVPEKAPDLSKMTVNVLKNLAAKRGIALPPQARKPAIIKLLS